jgi:hypothetical protein
MNRAYHNAFVLYEHILEGAISGKKTTVVKARLQKHRA